ncbi:MAG: hypothetical protein JRE61_08505 [Deltaproteobacteria bacterium]|nr:hypothetical protein [Deltaproteobacteria bacterium]
MGTKTTQSGCWKNSEKLEAVLKTVDLLKGVSPSSCNLAKRVMNPKIACGASKVRLFVRVQGMRFPEQRYLPARALHGRRVGGVASLFQCPVT